MTDISQPRNAKANAMKAIALAIGLIAIAALYQVAVKESPTPQTPSHTSEASRPASASNANRDSSLVTNDYVSRDEPSASATHDRTIVSSVSEARRSMSDTGVAEPSALEREKLEELKEKVALRASTDKNVPAGDFVDYIRLFKAEPRDQAWAPRAEYNLTQALSGLSLERDGMSRPVIRCATSVCEIMVIQNFAGTQNLRTNWQTRFSEFANSRKLGAVAGTATLTTDVGDDRVGFISYVVADKGPHR